MIDAYYLFKNLPPHIKNANGFRSIPRLDCIKYMGNYQGLDAFKNARGMFYLYPTDTSNFIDRNGKRIPTIALSNGTYNLSSIHTESLDNPGFAYGYPNPNKRLENGKENPLFDYRLDGYLFVKNEDLSQIEILVIKGGRNLITEAFQRLLDGDFDSELEKLRAEASVFYNYKEFF